jgi:hypothetical protein
MRPDLLLALGRDQICPKSRTWHGKKRSPGALLQLGRIWLNWRSETNSSQGEIKRLTNELAVTRRERGRVNTEKIGELIHDRRGSKGQNLSVAL